MNVGLVVLGIFLFLGLVVVHEFGHFIMAKRNGVEVLEFGIGMPPRIKGWTTKGGWLFTLNWLPIGGFVRLKGEHDTDTEPGSLGAASVWAKTQIMAAGVVMNLITAYLLLTVLALTGLPQLVPDQFTVKSDVHYMQHAQSYIVAETVVPGSPAAQAGIRNGDEIIALGRPGQEVRLTNDQALPQLTKTYAGQAVDVTYRHDAKSAPLTKQATLLDDQAVQRARDAGKQAGYLGLSVSMAQRGLTLVRSTWSAPVVAAGVMGQFTALTFQGLGKAVQGLAGIAAGFVTHNTAARVAAQSEASSQVAGPVGIFFIFTYGSALGLRFILFIVAVLSLTLAIMNLLPIPALDGGRLWLMLATRAIKRPLSPEREEAINAAGFVFLMSLVILISIVDVRRFF